MKTNFHSNCLGAPSRRLANWPLLRRPHQLAGLLLLVAATAHGDLRSLVSPGPLAAPHQKLDRQCDKCHQPFKGLPAERCLACHERAAAQIKSGRGPHAAWAAQKCSTCHRDHKGRDHRLTPPLDEARFDHRTTTFLLDGQHAKAKCAACHRAGPTGPQWAGVATTCKGCHGDTAHKGSLGDRCAACHNTFFWKPPSKRLADHRMAMTGGHDGLACAKCHKGGAHLESKESKKGLDCGSCHQEKHGGTKAPCASCHQPESWKRATFQHTFCTCILPGKHQSAPCLSCHPNYRFAPTPFACAACHKKDLKHEDLGACARCHSALSWKKKAFDHNKKVVGFPIEGKHAEVGCENCHTKPGLFSGAPKSCEGCHKVPDHGDFGPCAKCHTTAGFAPASFRHDQTRFPLDGAHEKVSCATCHGKFKPGTFSPGPGACATCHGDPHKGQFGGDRNAAVKDLPRRRLASPFARLQPDGLTEVHAPRNQKCLDCHTTRAWTPSTITVERHRGFDFPLQGAHTQLACAKCHAGGAFVATSKRCADCHFDMHGGKLGGECQRCHSEAGFSPVKDFDHRAATGFALDGPHGRAPCAACHGEDRERLSKLPRPITCATCHAPKHGNQFGQDCQSCHRPTTWREVPAFAHGQKTSFPLERRHAALPCAACHDARRGERLSPICQTCHGDPHRGTTGVECSACHRADRWLLVRFDHDRSEFPLRGRHFVTACQQCHRNQQWQGVRGECVTCHAQDRPANPNHMARGWSCGQAGCHVAFGWHAF